MQVPREPFRIGRLEAFSDHGQGVDEIEPAGCRKYCRADTQVSTSNAAPQSGGVSRVQPSPVATGSLRPHIAMKVKQTMLRTTTALMACLYAIPSVTIMAVASTPALAQQAVIAQAPTQSRAPQPRSFARGDVLPEAYRAKVVKNPYHQGLTPPGRDHQWVQVGRTFYRIDRKTGEIAERLDH